MKTVKTYRAEIFIAGDISQAKQVCREWCLAIGGCVTVAPTEFIYTGGQEAGVRVGFINYPRFPASDAEIFSKAESLAECLRQQLCQHSYSIVADDKTVWFSSRHDTQEAPQ